MHSGICLTLQIMTTSSHIQGNSQALMRAFFRLLKAIQTLTPAAYPRVSVCLDAVAIQALITRRTNPLESILIGIGKLDAGTAYTPRQITALENSSEDFSMMLYCIRTVLGGKLSTTDISTLAYFYDTLHFSADLIEYLIEYCATNGHTSFRYIEKVALNWAENGITTVKEAKAYSMNYNEATYSVLEAFGITNRAPGKIELDYINKWSDEYHLSTDIILEACNRTIKTTHQPSFEYADSILTRWKKADVKTPDDIKALDAEFEQSQQEKRSLKDSKTSQRNNSSVATNRFNNFQQHNYDMDSLEKALLSKNG